MHTKSGGEKPLRHHSYNGHGTRTGPSSEAAPGILKSKSNSHLHLERDGGPLFTHELRRMDKPWDLSSPSSSLLNRSEGTTERKSWDSLVHHSEFQKSTAFGGINSNNLNESGRKNEDGKDLKESLSLRLVSGVEERKNRYNVLLSQLPSSTATIVSPR